MDEFPLNFCPKNEKENRLQSPLCLKKTPKFNNTLKKNHFQEHPKKPLVESTNNSDFSQGTNKKFKLKKSNSINIQKPKEEILGFVKNTVEIIGFPVKKHKKIDVFLAKASKESTEHSKSRIRIPTIESILLEKLPRNAAFSQEKAGTFALNGEFQQIFEALDEDLRHSYRDKSIINNLNMLCLIQRNLKEIAQRKKNYLKSLLIEKSHFIESGGDFQKYSQETLENLQENIPQSPVDEYFHRENAEIKLERSKSVCNPEKIKEIGENRGFLQKTKKKLKTIDLDESLIDEDFEIAKKNSESNENSDSTAAELLKMLSVRTTEQPESLEKSEKVEKIGKNDHEFRSKARKMAPVLKGKSRDEAKSSIFFREFVINYPLSKKTNALPHTNC